MAWEPRLKKCSVAFIFTFIFFLVFSLQCFGEEAAEVTSGTGLSQELNIGLGKSIVVKSTSAVKRVSLGDPKIADILVLSPRQMYLAGKAAGTTNLTLWSEGDRISAIFDVIVSPDTAGLKKRLHEILPEEENIRIIANHDNITLYGNVGSAANLSMVLALAESYAPQKVTNFLEVSGVHQVMLEVRVSEMSRDLMKRLGFNFSYASGADFGLSMLNGLTTSAGGVSAGVNALFRFHRGNASWTGFIDALKEDGLIELLAEPTLIALSGQPASFLAGGEIPVPVADETSVSIEYKQYGVGLGFTPTVLGNGKISMKVAPEVSELDYANAVYLYGYLVPALTTRRATTVVEMADGQSFAIAGLIKNTARENVSKFPILGDIPVLGALFRSSTFQKNESELVIIVTPRLVKPLDMMKQTLPTDQYIEPSDFEYYLLGALEGKSRSPVLGKQGGLEGEFGHMTP